MDAMQRTAYAKLAGIDPPLINPLTGDEQALVRLSVTPRSLMYIIPGGQLVYGREVKRDADGNETETVNTGENYVSLYQAHADATLELVEDAPPELMKRARNELEIQRANWLEANEGLTLAECPCNFPAAFAHVAQRSLKPLLSAEVIESRGKRKSA